MIAFMAVYPDVQRKVLEEVTSLTNGDLSAPLVSILVTRMSNILNPPRSSHTRSIYQNLYDTFFGFHAPILSLVQVYTTAVFHESIRLCTVAPRLGRVAIADTTLQARRFKVGPDGSPQGVEEFPVNIRQGAQVLMDLTAVHMNRK
jgi:cytochrome P450